MIKLAMMTIMAALTGCSALDTDTGASEQEWSQVDLGANHHRGSGYTYSSMAVNGNAINYRNVHGRFRRA